LHKFLFLSGFGETLKKLHLINFLVGNGKDLAFFKTHRVIHLMVNSKAIPMMKSGR
jgi:hypothetical protein